MRWSPAQLAEDAGGRLLRDGGGEIESAFIDSRTPREGGLFVPIVAARDGHDFIEGALRAGAGATLLAKGKALPPGEATVVEVEDTLDGLTQLARSARSRRAQAGVPAVAITGSNGKTTTRAMVKAVLDAHFERVLSTQGNFNNHLGVPLSLLDAPHEPDAEVLELGMSAPGENAHLASIVQPQIGVVTSVALEHLEFMGSIEAIARAEAELMAFVAAGGALVIPSDESLLEAEIPDGYAPKVWRVGPDAHADVQIESVRVGAKTQCRFRLPDHDRIELALSTFGAHNARNAASALAVGLHLGIDLNMMREAIEAVVPVGDRGRLHEHGPHLLVADCYNANPGSMEVALRSLAALRDDRDGPLIAVLGDMLELGPTGPQLHAQVGRLAADLGIDGVLAFGRASQLIAEGASEGGIRHVNWIADPHEEASVQRAVEWIGERLGHAEAGAALFKASRGIRLERVVEGLRSA
ncbi:MAG: UDP-N-acetylmuramoyl-tripeptide--D-alanyl-D-alanine ligase [bacterium]|nr:UDP-N-acetylmuramoyl-tripeptide--D-alanyl-D-alanine ligase [bacterium]